MDDSKQITASDPRVAQILAMIQAKQQPVETLASPSGQTIPQQPTAQLGPPLGNPQMASTPPQMPALPPANVQPTQQPAPTKPGPIKSFLQGLVSNLGGAAYQGTQGALQRLGIPTDYEKQQNAAHLAIAQQTANDTSEYRKATTDNILQQVAQHQASQAPMTIPKDDRYGAFSGMTLPTAAATPIMQRMEALANAKDIATGKENSAETIAADKNAAMLQGKSVQYGPNSYLRRGIRSVNGKIEMYDKGATPDANGHIPALGILGTDTAMITGPRNAQARANAQASVRSFDTTDENGAPTTISGLDAVRSGAAHVPYTQAKGVLSDRVGVQQYQQILDKQISPNLSVLNDNSQRIAIAHTLSELDKNPGAAQALLTSALQNGALTPEGAKLTAGIMQSREFGGVARKYGGNMNGTEGLMNRIMANQASPLNSLQLNQDLVANDRAFTDRALKSIDNLTTHSAKGTTVPQGNQPSSSQSPRPSWDRGLN